MRFIFNNTGRGLIEAIFSIAVIIIVSSVFTGYWIILIGEARKVALENQLTNVRYSLELYRIIEGSYPEDLRGLDKRCLAIKEDSLYGRTYLEHQSKDEEGYPIDPYGRRFIYDRKTGRVKEEI